MRIGRRIDDNAVLFLIGGLDCIYNHALVVALHHLDLDFLPCTDFFDERDKSCIGIFAVDLRFTDSKHI